MHLMVSALENVIGKLLVYTSALDTCRNRLKSISIVTEKMAKALGLSVEFVTCQKELTPIYIYYASGDEEPIPVYCDKNEETSVQEICKNLRNMMFVLSFHPKHSALKQARKAIMQFS